MDFMLDRGICGDIVRNLIVVCRPNGQELERGNEIMKRTPTKAELTRLANRFVEPGPGGIFQAQEMLHRLSLKSPPALALRYALRAWQMEAIA